MGETDENSFGAADVAEAIGVLVLNDFTDELRAVGAEGGEGGRGRDQGAVRIVRALAQYGDYFDHAGWRPVVAPKHGK